MPGTRQQADPNPALLEKEPGSSATTTDGPDEKERSWHQRWSGGAYTGQIFLAFGGYQVQIVDPGRSNADAGPDFVDALIRLDGELIRGDVEIHRHAADWYAHKHHLDPRYNHVIMHAVAAVPPAGFATRSVNGREIPLAILPSVTASDFYAVNSSGTAQSGYVSANSACALASLNPPVVHKILEQYGRERLSLHAARFAELRQTRQWEEILYSGLLDALGYGKNQISFRRLSERLPYAAVAESWRISPGDPVKMTEAMLFGAAGFFDDSSPLPAKGYLTELQLLWKRVNAQLHITPLPSEIWIFFRLRPYNFPTRRLAAAAALLVRLQRISGLFGLALMAERYRQEPQRGAAAFEQFALTQSSGYWREHFHLQATAESAPPVHHSSLVGRSRSRELAVNVFLPLLLAYARECGDGRLQTLVLQFYLLFAGSGGNWITRTMQHKISGAAISREEWKALNRLAVLQQGLIELHKMHCQPAPCHRCLTPEASRSLWPQPD